MGARKIQEAIQHLAGVHGKDEVGIIECEVTAVHEDKRTCDCKTVGNEITVTDVRLMAEVDDGILVLPVVGSIIIVAYTKRISPFVCQFSETEKVLLITGDTTIEIKDGLVKFNDGSYDGFVKIQDLVKKLNTLEKDLNTLKQAFSSWVVAPNDGGAALKAAAANWIGQQITETQQDDLENKAITHGK